MHGQKSYQPAVSVWVSVLGEQIHVSFDRIDILSK
jgi:hypothetical protein